jgi:hypothetical protein
MGVTQQASIPLERTALSRIMWYSVIQIAGLVVSQVVSFYVTFSVFYSSGIYNLPANSTPSQVSAALTPLFQDLSFLAPFGIALGLVGAIFLALGLRSLGRVDASQFSLPWKFMIVFLIGIAVVAVALVPLLLELPNLISQVPVTSTTPSADFISAIGTLLLAALVVSVGGIMVLIGAIGGVMLGLWRVGARYGETIIKVAAIFTIIPLLSIVAPILVLIGAYQAKGRLGKPQ